MYISYDHNATVLGTGTEKRHFLAGETIFETRAIFSWPGLDESHCLESQMKLWSLVFLYIL